MTRTSKKKAVPVGKDLYILPQTQEQQKYAEATILVRELVEELSGRNFESFTLSELMKVRPITLELTQVLADKGINAQNWKEHKEFLDEIARTIMEKLRAIDMLRVDLI